MRRFVTTSLTVWSALGLYFVIACANPFPPTTVGMPSWVPFWPVFALPYLGMLLAAWLLPVAIRDAGRFCACLRAMICAYLLVMPWWVLAPTTLLRLPAPEVWWAGPYLWIVAIDPPNNVMPCAHCIGPMAAAWFVGRERPTWRWPLAGMLALGLSSIALVWQHRPIDILLGSVATVIGLIVGEGLNRRQSASQQKFA